MGRAPIPVQLLTAAALTTALLAVAACSSGGTSGGSSKPYTVTAGVLHAFTGQNAFFGSNASNACKAAAQQINAGGGIANGNMLTCPSFDTKGDPADAVPVADQMLVSASHLAMVVGPDGNDIPSVLPRLEHARIPEMNTVGDPRYDTQTSKYFWRLTPSDSTQAPALASYTVQRGYTRVVELFTNDLSAQTTTAPFETKYAALGGVLAEKLSIAPDQASYQTEASRIVAAHPQAIVGEMDARTAATLLGEVKQLNGGTIIPLVITQRATQADWAPAVLPVLGPADMKNKVVAVAPTLSGDPAATAAFQSSIAAVGGNSFQKNNPIVAATYDGVIAFALAMDLANSTDPAAYVADIPKVTAAGPNATVVHTYAAGVAALKAGKTIQYVGASGPMVFDSHNTATRPYAAWTFDPTANAWNAGSPLS